MIDRTLPRAFLMARPAPRAAGAWHDRTRTRHLNHARVAGQFFDQELLGRRSPLLAGTEKLPEVAARKLPR